MTQRTAHNRPSDPHAAPERVLSTLNADGSRRWLTPRVSPGRFLRARWLVGWLLIVIFTAIPHIRIGGSPLVLLDLPTRRFVIFGTTFLPSDTLLLALLMVGVFVTIFFMTALFGRVWCGWGCPQTVYLEFVYRPIERFFEGAPGRRKRTWQGSGAAKVAKYVVYLVVSCVLAHTFVAYFVDVRVLWEWMRQPPFEHPTAFLVMAAVTTLMMADFTFFREQICILACPYGRFQSVMLDRQSLVVTYDSQRGEPRGPLHRDAPSAVALPIVHGDAQAASDAEKRTRGDCVACNLCVTTCPTGIDIRDGLQMECVGCAQCIDACDAVMMRIGKPRGLIRYSSQAAVAGEKVHLLRPRVIIYPLLLVVIATAFSVVLMRTGGPQMAILRGVGPLFTQPEPGFVANTVRLRLVARDSQPVEVEIVVTGVDGLRMIVETNPVELRPQTSITVPITLFAPRDAFEGGRLRVDFTMTSDGRQRTIPFTMQGPRGDAGATRTIPTNPSSSAPSPSLVPAE